MSSKRLRHKVPAQVQSESQSEDMKDFIDGPNLRYGYDGASDSNEDDGKNGANIQDAPKLKQDKVQVKISNKKLEQIFAQKVDEEDSDDDLAQLIAKKEGMQKREKAILQQKLDVSKLNQIMESSKAKARTEHSAQKNKDALQLPHKVLSAAEAQNKFKDLPDQISVYITDVYENHTDKRRLYVFGVTSTGQRLIIQVKDVDRCMYFIMKPDKEDQDEIEKQIGDRLKQSGIHQYDGQFVKMNYVFEIEGLPRGQVLTYKVRYSFLLESKDPPKPNWQGRTFKYVIGTTYSALQLFVMKNQIKGPQWVSMEKKYLQLNTKIHGTTSLPVDLIVAQSLQVPKNIKQLRVPKLRVASIAIKVTKPCDVKKNIFPSSAPKDKSLIYSISMQYSPNYNIESKTKVLQLQSILFCLSSFGHPNLSSKNTKIIKCESETELIVRFFDAIQGFDPDIIACHDSTLILDTIISRADNLNLKQKTRVSRLGSNRQIPNIGNLKQRLMLILAGRLLVDTYFHAKDLVKSVDYSLPFISTMLPIGKTIQDIRNDQANVMLANGQWSKIALHCLEESEGTFNLMNHLQIVQLSRQLTNICGNLWKRSLDNARAERNEFLMMHECEAQNIIIPDKFYKQKGQQDGQKREKYQGGYVLQPEKDLYTDYILLLDFNSLYPSIIREYNICFSKVKRHLLPLSYYYKPKKDGKQKQIDDPKAKIQEDGMAKNQFKVEVVRQENRTKQNWGFLPKLINTIVDKRKQFKKKMAALADLASAEFERRQDEYMAHEITQKSYKLVANSIYGCLGFQNSRFYARDLAALITEKGRDALKRAKELVQRQGGAIVIYGDTDSLMIKIDMEQEWNEVRKIRHIYEVAQKLRKDINNQYKNKMLQIDIDGVFKPLNLIAKKKYMAKKLSNFDKVRIEGVNPTFTVEYKGIQVAKRDGCQKSRKSIKDIFDIVLNNMVKIQDATTQIYDYFQKLDMQMQNIKQQTQYKNYLLAKQLNKHPNQYKHGAQNLPHIRVAKKLIENGQKAQKLINHAIYYLIVQSENSKASVADRAVDETSFLRSLKTTSPMKIDINYYKISQILPPILRILANVKSIDKSYIHQKFKIPTSLRKQVQKIQYQAEGRQYQAVEYQCVTTDLDTPVNIIFPEFQCPGFNCTKRYPVCKTGMFTHKCMNQLCEFKKQLSLLPVISNLISNYMFIKTLNFSNPEYKCRKCNKVWKVQVKECMGCNQSKFEHNSNASELHNTLYLVLKVLRKMQGNYLFVKNPPIMAIENMVKSVLSGSSFQVVQRGFMSKLRFVK